MKMSLRLLSFVLLPFLGLASTAPGAETETQTEAQNRAVVQAAFDDWRAGTGGPFALLAPEATWTIAGNSLAAKTYRSRDEFIDVVIKPFNARLTKLLVPTVRSLHSDGDTVVVLFDAEALARDGQPYRNTYAWFMKLRAGRVVDVTAFFDAHAFDAFWRRVTPQEGR